MLWAGAEGAGPRTGSGRAVGAAQWGAVEDRPRPGAEETELSPFITAVGGTPSRAGRGAELGPCGTGRRGGPGVLRGRPSSGRAQQPFVRTPPLGSARLDSLPAGCVGARGGRPHIAVSSAELTALCPPPRLRCVSLALQTNHTSRGTSKAKRLCCSRAADTSPTASVQPNKSYTASTRSARLLPRHVQTHLPPRSAEPRGERGCGVGPWVCGACGPHCQRGESN